LETELEERRDVESSVGAVAGLVFGLLAVAMMLPMAFPDKRTALLRRS